MMKKGSWLIICFFSVTIYGQDSISGKGINWETNKTWDQIIAKAKSEGKYIFVDAFTTWCVPCKLMDQEVYSKIGTGIEVNKNFISLKLQMDTTLKDDAFIKNSYFDAHNLKTKYDIHQFPALLFFDPNGILLLKEFGYRKINDFLRLTKLALDPQRPYYFEKLEAYKRGEKDYQIMDKLAIFAKKLVGDKKLAEAIAADYKINFLDKKKKETLLAKEHFDFIDEFPTLISINDNIFTLCYNEPLNIDSLKGFKGWAAFQVERAIKRMILDSNLLKNKKVIYDNPNWNHFVSLIEDKYPKIDAKKLVLSYQINYYRFSDLNWAKWATYKEEMIKLYPPTPPYGLSIYMDINTFGAWEAFLHCNDKSVLAKAIEWINLAINLEPTAHIANYLDTKANLLYKLGRIEEALILEKKALETNPNDKEIASAFKKMQRKEPTWPIQGNDTQKVTY